MNLLSFIYAFLILQTVGAQQAHVKLSQGNILGIKVYPDGSHTAVNAFLGVPYAQAPINDMRFAAPKAHNGWNTTLNAISFKSVCPQLSNTIYDESPDGLDSRVSRIETLDEEDCLFLNIWVSETGMGYGNLPVLVVITGEEMSYDWPRNRISGLDLALENVLVITVQYRSNIFGWISLQSNEIPGNFGMQDTELALHWIQQNIQRFGGNPQQITLLGHGTTGAPLALSLTLLIKKKNNDRNQLISKLILMSGGDIPYALAVGHQLRVAKTSKLIIQKLSCHFEERHNQIITCLRTKSVSDLLRAYETIYKNGNGTMNLGMTIPQSLGEILLNNQEEQISLPPIMIGIGTNEGAFLQDYWLDLAREGYKPLKDYITNTVLPNVLRRILGVNQTLPALDSILWRYFGDENIGDVTLLLMGLGRLISESNYEAPFYNLLKQLSHGSNATFAYVFRNTNTMYDLRGKMNYFGGASHTSELPLLFGPSLFKAISRRRFTANEERLSKKLRRIFVSFVRNSNPTRGHIYDSWLSYTQWNSFIYNLGDDLKTTVDGVDDMLQSNEGEIQKLIVGEKHITSFYQAHENNYQNNYMNGNMGDLRQSKSAAAHTSYFSNQQDSGYAIHLRRVYGFWKVFLTTNVRYNESNTLFQRLQLMEASAEAARYRHGFFALLSLVCLLLMCLCLCVYLLRRNPLNLISSTSDRDSRYCL